MIIPNAEEGGYLAEVLELPGCITEGETPEEAYNNLQDAMLGWIAASLDTKRPIPEPVGDKEYSGHFPLRMSTELHRAAALRAMQEGVSLNQWIAGAIAEKVAKENLAEALAGQIAAKVAERIPATLSAGAFWLQISPAAVEGASPPDFVKARLDPGRTDSAVAAFYDILRTPFMRQFQESMNDAIEAEKEVKQNA